MTGGVRLSDWRVTGRDRMGTHLPKATVVSAFTAWMFVGMMVEALIGALLYLRLPEITTFADLGTAFYFSMATFTSVGYGDVVLSGDWRILASLQGANGVIVFVWTTALIFYVIQELQRRKEGVDG